MNDSATSPEPAPAPPAATTAATTARRGSVASLARLWILRGAASSAPITFAHSPLILLILICVALWIGIDRWEAGPGAQFFADNIPLLAWYGLGAVLLAALQRARSRPVPSWPTLLTLIAAWMPLPIVITGLAVPMLDTPWLFAACVLAAVYSVCYFVRGLAAASGARQFAAPALSIIFIAAFAYCSDALNVVPAMWMPLDEESASNRPVLAVSEDTLFDQAARIDDALDSLSRDPRATARAYFLGFAGVGEERVFAQEIGLAARVLGGRYHIKERTLSLVNDERDLDSAPLASVWSLRYALQGLARRMNVDRDVLFLSISSHGAPEPAIVVSNSELPLEDLTAPALAQALDDAGIQWRVIVISACYAGGFVDALRNPYTIVITAAAKDRTSFGCGNDSDLTYFGEAFYRDALPDTASLRAAFDAAKAAIAARERREHVEASEPQAYFGGALEQKLSALQ